MDFENPPWQLRKTVFPQHTDHAGVMWHGSYFKWLEEARIDALSKVGISYSELSLAGFEIPVVSCEIKYLKPLYHGQDVLLHSWPLLFKGVRWSWITRFFDVNISLATEAKINLALVQKNENGFQIVRKVPNQYEQAFSKLHIGPSSL